MKENETKKFDKNAYNAKYMKEKYKDIKIHCTPEIYNTILNYCKDMNISRQKFVQLACLYVIDNDLFGEIVQKDEKIEKNQKKKKTPEEIAEEMNKGL